MEKKIDRPLVKMTRTRDDGGYNYEWYKTMMGKQSQIINIIKDTNNTLTRIHEMDKVHVNLLEEKVERLSKEVDKLNSRGLVFKPWNLFKKKKNVGN